MTEKKVESIICDVLDIVATTIKGRMADSYAYPEATAVYCESKCILDYVEGLKSDPKAVLLQVEAMEEKKRADSFPDEEKIARIIDEVAEDVFNRNGLIVKSVPITGLDGIVSICGYTNPVSITLAGRPSDRRVTVELTTDDGLDCVSLPIEELPYFFVKLIYRLLTELP